jgi:hypothetical protein
MKKDINSYILTRLGRAASEDDVIYSICQKAGLDWEHAQALVEQVKNEHLDEIDTGQMPLKGALSSVFYASRCALLGWFQLPSIFFTMLVGVGIIGANIRYMSGIWENLFSRWNMIE